MLQNLRLRPFFHLAPALGFLAHSLGYLVIAFVMKVALWQSSGCQHSLSPLYPLGPCKIWGMSSTSGVKIEFQLTAIFHLLRMFHVCKGAHCKAVCVPASILHWPFPHPFLNCCPVVSEPAEYGTSLSSLQSLWVTPGGEEGSKSPAMGLSILIWSVFTTLLFWL